MGRRARTPFAVPQNLDFAELQAFLAVVAERSFSRAAMTMHRTQSPVSYAVRRLERKVGERLFHRSSNNGALTDAMSGYAARPMVQGVSEGSPGFETVATLPSADTENVFEAPDGSIYVTGMDAKVVWKVTPDRRVEKFATVPSVAFVVGIASTGEGFALTAFGRPFRRAGAPGQPPQIDFSDIDPQIILLDKTGTVTAAIPGQKGQAFNGITPSGDGNSSGRRERH